MPDLSWARSGLAGAVREILLSGVVGPLMDLYTRRRIAGLEHLTGTEASVIFVANHSSHMDTPTILRALPRSWRRRTAVAAAADYFYRVWCRWPSTPSPCSAREKGSARTPPRTWSA